jgi:ATP-dependent 26S proteasome regulatory subunit
MQGFIPLHAHNETNLATTASSKQSGVTIEGLVGTFPTKVRFVINQLKDVATALHDGSALPEVFKNRLLLYGPPGNGKTTIAKKIAEQAGAASIYKNTPELISKYQGQSALTIKNIFDEARNHAELNFKPVVIIFDEIDTLSANVETEQRAEYLATLQELWHQLDIIQNDARLFFIGLTNKEELHATFKTRFGNNIEKIGAPNEKVRREVLQYYKTKYTGTPWNEDILNEFVAHSAGSKISIRFLEDYVFEAYMVAKNDHRGIITDTMARTLFYEMKEKYSENWTQWTKRQVKAHWPEMLNVALVAVRIMSY